MSRTDARPPKTRFRIGHASKALTSAAVGLLLENGRLNLDDEIQTYVPSFRKSSGQSRCAS
jgi:CubicO group peptidase (beta-lactamase class C family)